MTSSDPEILHISARIDRPAGEVYDYASDPRNLPAWASGLSSSITETDGRWVADSPMGKVSVSFAPRNDYGILDHEVTLPSGEAVHNPVRVIPDTAGCDVVFTLRRQPGMSDADFRRDAETVSADLATLKHLLEGA
ncbi:SRPBCC family protein [Streptomyces sp. NPDC059166]|uniref:SRPBCC family protein n=1 Tax=Streptomyces sp. NPDC059166 TaxID=3346752 RepID=UPI00367910B0